MTKLVSPVKGYNGFIGDVEFVDGVAETDNESVIRYAKNAGYGVGNSKPIPEETAIFLDGPLHETDETKKIKHGPFTQEEVEQSAAEQGKQVPEDTHLVSPNNGPVDAADPDNNSGNTAEPDAESEPEKVEEDKADKAEEPAKAKGKK